MSIALITRDVPDAEIQAFRRRTLGSSELAAAMTGHASEVILRKQGLLRPLTETDAMRDGKALEALVAERCAQQLADDYPGADIHVGKADRIFRHDLAELSFRTSSPDYFLVFNHPAFPFSGRPGAIECKTTSERLFDAWADGPAPYAHWQSLDQCDVCGFAFVIAACWSYGQPLRMHVVEPDGETTALLHDAARNLWRHVEAGTFPGVDELSLADLRNIYPREEPGKVVALPEVARRHINERAAALEQITAYQGIADAAEARLKAIMRDAELGILPGVEVRWKSSTREAVDTKMLQKLFPDAYDATRRQSQQRTFRVVEK